jgi:hypothetical protein
VQPAYFLTPEELLMVEVAQQSGEIPYTREPAVIRGVMNTQLSIARHYGAIKLNSFHYTYFPAGDELIRDDVLKHVTRWRKEAAKQAKVAAKAAQGALL